MSDLYELERGCLRKRQYRYRKRAQEVLTTMKKQRDTGKKLEVYFCRFCKHYHIGNNSRRKQKKNQHLIKIIT